MEDLSKQAIEAFLNGDFKKAILLNKEILKEDKKNVEALNRLGCAYLQIGDIKNAQKAYKKGLLYDKCNPIIIKNLKKLVFFKKKSTDKIKDSQKCFLDTKDLFLNEPGKTKIISLINLPPIDVFINLKPGTYVSLIIKKRSILVYLNDGNKKGDKKNGVYLGTIPDNLSFKLKKMIKGGNIYQAYIKSVQKKDLSIFIREVFRSKKFKNQPSFGINLDSNNNCSQ